MQTIEAELTNKGFVKSFSGEKESHFEKDFGGGERIDIHFDDVAKCSAHRFESEAGDSLFVIQSKGCQKHDTKGIMDFVNRAETKLN